MSSTTPINCTPAALFPDKITAATDPKCVVIAAVIEQLVRHTNANHPSQATIQADAAQHYAFLSQPEHLPLPLIDPHAFRLFQNGVTPATIKTYYSFRLSETDIARWQITVV